MYSANVASSQTIPLCLKVSPAVVDAYVKKTWTRAPDGWQLRVDHEETQRICSVTRNSPSSAEFEVILAREKTLVKFPADGNVMGDWRRGATGATVTNRGHRGQFSDQPDTYRSGNCYACHQIAKAEVSSGTFGPSLMNYGKDRKFDKEEARATYMKSLQCPGGHAVLTDATLRLPQFLDRAADQGRRGLSVRPRLAGQQRMTSLTSAPSAIPGTAR
jgi:L-cysteine S-thiosulfotransferase